MKLNSSRTLKIQAAIESNIEISHDEGTFLNHLQSSQEAMHSSSAMTSTLSLSLPPELWRMILSTFRSSLLECFDEENVTYLWTQCRLVSKQFKYEIEIMFIDAHLPKMVLCVDIISCYDGIEYCFYDVVNRRQTTFVGLAENRDVGIARVDNEYWRSFLQPHGGDDRKEKMPYHVVQILDTTRAGPILRQKSETIWISSSIGGRYLRVLSRKESVVL